MLSVFRLFFRAEGTRPYLVLACMVLASCADAIGFSSLVPAVAQIEGGPTAPTLLSTMTTSILAFAGLPHTLGWLIILFCAAIAVKVVLAFTALNYAGRTFAHVATDIRSRLIGQLMAARWGYYAGQRVGRIANAISNDATRAGQAYFAAARFIALLVQGVVYIALAFFISAKLALAGLVVGGVVAACLSVFVRISRRAGTRQADRTSELVTYVTDALNNIKPLKTMERQAAFQVLFEHKIAALRRSLVKLVVAKNGLVYGEDLVLSITVGTAVYVAAVILEIKLSEMVVMGLIFWQAVSIVSRTQQMCSTLRNTKAATGGSRN